MKIPFGGFFRITPATIMRRGPTFRLARPHPTHARSSGLETSLRIRSLADYTIDTHESELSEATRPARSLMNRLCQRAPQHKPQSGRVQIYMCCGRTKWGPQHPSIDGRGHCMTPFELALQTALGVEAQRFINKWLFIWYNYNIKVVWCRWVKKLKQ